MRLLHRPTKPNQVLPTAYSQWERDELEASAARMRSQYHKTDQAKIKPNPQVGEVRSLRERILNLSLFPNIHNRSFIMKEGATTS